MKQPAQRLAGVRAEDDEVGARLLGLARDQRLQVVAAAVHQRRRAGHAGLVGQRLRMAQHRLAALAHDARADRRRRWRRVPSPSPSKARSSTMFISCSRAPTALASRIASCRPAVAAGLPSTGTSRVRYMATPDEPRSPRRRHCPSARGACQLTPSNCDAAFSSLSAVCSIFICASNWRAAAIIATIVSTALTFEPSSAPSCTRAVGVGRQVAVGGAEQAVVAALQRRFGRDQLELADRRAAGRRASLRADGAVGARCSTAVFGGTWIGPPSPSTGQARCA